VAVIDSLYPAGLSVPGHRHDGEDEMFYLLAGAVELFCEDDRWTAGPGDFVFVPRGACTGSRWWAPSRPERWSSSARPGSTSRSPAPAYECHLWTVHTSLWTVHKRRSSPALAAAATREVTDDQVDLSRGRNAHTLTLPRWSAPLRSVEE